MGSSKFEIEKFDGKGDFPMWKKKMRAVLVQQKCAKAIGDPSDFPEMMKSSDKQEILETAYSLLILNLADNVLRQVDEEDTALKVWNKLESLYMIKSLSNKIYLKEQLFGFKMDSSKNLEENLDDFKKITVSLANIDEKISEENQAIILLNSLPESYKELKAAIKYGRDSLTLDDVLGALRSRELEIKIEKKATSEGLQVRGRTPRRDHQKGRGKSRSKSRGKRVCWHCQKEGHLRRNCPDRKKGSESIFNNDLANLSDGYVNSEVLTVSTNQENNEWIMDSGCSYHMTPRKELMFDFKPVNGGKVLMGNDHVCSVNGAGSIKFKLWDGSIRTIENVRWVPQLRRNLLSLGMFDKNGCSYKSEGGKLRVLKGSMVVLRGSLQHGLYILEGRAIDGMAAAVKDEDKTRLWHRRLGHISLRGLQELCKQGILDSKSITSLEFCETCVLGKTHKLKFAKATHISNCILEYVHADLWGSSFVPMSLTGYQYFMSIIDDYSRRVWVYFLKHKNQAFAKFKEWKIMVENQTGKRLKKLRTDNGLEFCNREFNDYCTKQGIARHRTCTETPQQNGLAERMNRTILDKVRCMLSESNLPKRFWAEATNTAVYLINRSPCSSINFQTPMHVWTGKKPNLSHLKPFGCLAYIHVNQGKLNPRALKGIFIGYPSGVKGYKIWLIEEKKCVISRNIIFHEDALLRTNLQEQKIPSETDKFQLEVEKHPDHITQGSLDETSDQDEEVQVTPQSSRTTGSETQTDEESTLRAVNRLFTSGQDRVQDDEPVQSTSDQGGDLTSYQLARDRSRRAIRTPVRYAQADLITYALNIGEEIEHEEPATFQEACNSNESSYWLKAMKEEMISLEKNKTWKLVNKSPGQKIIGCKWVFKRKPGIPGVQLPRYKARVVAKGFTQVEGVDYHDIFSPVVKHSSIRLLLAYVAMFNLELEQLDVKTAFLHGNLEETLYMEQPPGFIAKGSENKVCLLLKSLYGLKQSPRQWYKKFDEFMLRENFNKSAYDSCVYFKRIKEGSYLYLLIYVDDMLIIGKEIKDINDLKIALNSEFEMKDLGPAKRILGIDIYRDRKRGILSLSQADYIQKVLKTFGMLESKQVSTPIPSHYKLKSVKGSISNTELEYMKKVPYCNAVGSLMYAMIATRPDIAYGVGLVSRFMSLPSKEHWQAVKWLLRYLKGSGKLGLFYSKPRNNQIELKGYCDADFAADLDRRRSLSGYVFTIGENVISWKSSLQHIVALSTTEAEYVALTEAMKEAIWLKGIINELKIECCSVRLYCDSQSAIHLSKNSMFHERTKHIDVRLHFVRDIISKEIIKVEKISTLINPADILTKAVPVGKFEEALNLLQVWST